MIAVLTNTLWRVFSLAWLTGPIFDKELRVSSRKRRNYFIRSLYVVLLTIFVVAVWAEEVRYGAPSLYNISRMARAGKTIIMFVVWFQFVATQIVAGIMLSTAISDEVYNRTLGVLMTTPINSFQIVIGKLFSRLLQTVILLAITLPLLAVIRVFGGVPWNFLLSGLCITLTTAIGVGSISLFYSIFCKRAYVVIIFTVLTMGLAFFVVPMMQGFLCNVIFGHWPGSKLTTAIFLPNPYAAMVVITENMMNPGRNGFLGGYSWLGHCAIALTASLILLSMCIFFVRRIALAQVSGGSITLFRKRPAAAAPGKRTTARPQPARLLRPVTGNCVHWKERVLPLFGHSKLVSRIVFSLGIALLLLTYIPVAVEGDFDHEDVQLCYGFILFGVGAIFTLVLPATVITSEKESRAWPLLLQTSLTEGQILIGKFLGVLRRCAVFWTLLFGHILVFTVFGCINPAAIVHIALIVFGAAIFVIGSGLLFSAWFKHTTAAVIANVAFALLVWGGIPLFMVMCLLLTHSNDDLLEAYADAIPVVQFGIVLDSSVPAVDHTYYWPGHNQMNTAQTTAWLLFCAILYSGLGILWASLAMKLFRKRIFHNT